MLGYFFDGFILALIFLGAAVVIGFTWNPFLSAFFFIGAISLFFYIRGRKFLISPRSMGAAVKKK